jgi:hypothetical protein
MRGTSQAATVGGSSANVLTNQAATGQQGLCMAYLESTLQGQGASVYFQAQNSRDASRRALQHGWQALLQEKRCRSVRL